MHGKRMKILAATALLICGGGPGIPQYLLEYLYPSVLPQEFTVCYWDYRGICTSYDSVLPAEEPDTARQVLQEIKEDISCI